MESTKEESIYECDEDGGPFNKILYENDIGRIALGSPSFESKEHKKQFQVYIYIGIPYIVM